MLLEAVQRRPGAAGAWNGEGVDQELGQHRFPLPLEDRVGGGHDKRPETEPAWQRLQHDHGIQRAAVVGNEDRAPLMVLTRYRSITVKGEKAPINGKMMKVCRMARAPRTVRARGQDGSLTGGWLVVSTFLPSGGPPAKVGAGADAGTSQAYLMARPLRATENVSAEISRNLALELDRATGAGARASPPSTRRADQHH